MSHGSRGLSRFLGELRRRRVISVMAGYAVAVYGVVAAVDLFVPILALWEGLTTLVLVCAITFAPVLAYLSWFFRFSPDGLARIADNVTAGEEDSPRPLSWVNWLGLLVIAGAATGAAVLLFEDVRSRRDDGQPPIVAAPQDRSLAVMVFRDLSPEQTLGYLGEGLAEELSAALGKQASLQVTAASSTRRFAERTDPPQVIGRELGVSSLLEGSVRLEGSRLLITANLIDAESGRTRWSERYARPLEDIFQIQEQIARSILNRLFDAYVAPEGERLTGQATSAEAYVMYLRGRQQFRERTPESIRQARRYFEQAVGLDPEYAPAYVGVADSVRLLARGVENYGDLDPVIAAQLAQSNVERALLRDPQLPQAYAALGQLAVMGGRNEDGLAAYDKAIALNPSLADAHHWRFLVLRNMARYADALESLETARQLDPLSPVILRNWAVEQSRMGNSELALQTFDKLIELDPASPVGYRAAAQVAYSSGDLLRSADYYHEVLRRSPDTEQYRVALADVFMVAGLADAAAALLDPEVYAVNLHIAAGEFSRALELIRFAHAADPEDALLTFEHAWYELLWGDQARGRELLRSIEDTILATGWFDRNYCSPQIEMAYAYPRGEDRERWLAPCRVYAGEQLASGYASSELSYLRARVAALDDDVDSARNAFVEAVALGWRQPWTARDPLLSTVFEQPEAARALTTIDEDLAAQRQGLAARARQWGYAGSVTDP
ncbi:MAG: tetratricopeptide repeat protein [Gammaproteobacteria bacterium]|nr:tetratricopeptide repeat protein [Gammaproteobacteria bacterium]